MEMMIMQSPNEQERFDFARNLIIEAGDLALQFFGNLAELSIMSKGPGTWFPTQILRSRS
jgi:hypothetical protein